MCNSICLFTKYVCVCVNTVVCDSFLRVRLKNRRRKRPKRQKTGEERVA